MSERYVPPVICRSARCESDKTVAWVYPANGPVRLVCSDHIPKGNIRVDRLDKS